MRAKGFSLSIFLVILTASTGCDNVEWAGYAMELQPPPSLAPPPASDRDEGDEERALEPVTLGTLVYLVEPSGGDRARLVPLAVLDGDGYAPLPDPAETPDLVERFPIDRWESGTEFILFSQGVRTGVFTADGTSRRDDSLCLPRVVSEGVLELRAGLGGEGRFLAMRRADLAAVPSGVEPHPALRIDDALRSASLAAAQNLISRHDIPWPTSIPDIRQRVDPLVDGEGRRSVAASFVFGDDLSVGPPASTAYSLFLLSTEGEDGFAPVFSWYQRQDEGGKAFPGFLAAHDVHGAGSPDLVLEVFEREQRSLAILGARGGDWQLVYQDPCGQAPARGALRTYD